MDEELELIEDELELIEDEEELVGFGRVRPVRFSKRHAARSRPVRALHV